MKESCAGGALLLLPRLLSVVPMPHCLLVDREKHIDSVADCGPSAAATGEE